MYYSNNPGSFVPVNQNNQVNFPNIPLPVVTKTQNRIRIPNDKRHIKFTKEEDERLKQLVKQYGKSWDKIAKHIPGRTPNSCMQRYYGYLNNSINLCKNPFTLEEDRKLIQSVGEHKEKWIYGETWKRIAKHMPGRTPQQCRDRWNNYLSNDNNRHWIHWTPEEEELLIQKRNELGNQWEKIACFFENRTPNNLQNHFYKLMSKRNKTTTSSILPQQISDATPIPLQQTFNAFNATLTPLQQTQYNLPKKPEETQEDSLFNNLDTTLKDLDDSLKDFNNFYNSISGQTDHNDNSNFGEEPYFSSRDYK